VGKEEGRGDSCNLDSSDLGVILRSNRQLTRPAALNNLINGPCKRAIISQAFWRKSRTRGENLDRRGPKVT
jgi:hypothetical protein